MNSFGSEHSSKSGIRVLIIDDDTGLLYAMNRLFLVRGYDTHIARDGADALEMARQHQYDVAVLDLWIPGTDGREIFKGLRQISPRLPIITMSAVGTACTREACEALGAFKYLQKPFGAEEIISCVEAAARTSSAAEVSESGGTNRGVILLADDHESFRITLARRLRGEGFIVDEAENGMSAVAAWRRRHYDLGVLDMHMPNGSGTEAAKSIHEIDRSATLAFMTGEATSREISANMRLAIADCITKPLSFEKIAEKISFLIDVGKRTRTRNLSGHYDSLSSLRDSFQNSAQKLRRFGRERMV